MLQTPRGVEKVLGVYNNYNLSPGTNAAVLVGNSDCISLRNIILNPLKNMVNRATYRRKATLQWPWRLARCQVMTRTNYRSSRSMRAGGRHEAGGAHTTFFNTSPRTSSCKNIQKIQKI